MTLYGQHRTFLNACVNETIIFEVGLGTRNHKGALKKKLHQQPQKSFLCCWCNFFNAPLNHYATFSVKVSAENLKKVRDAQLRLVCDSNLACMFLEKHPHLKECKIFHPPRCP